MPSLSQILKQAQKAQENLEKIQASLAETLVLGTAGGGLVKVTMTCRHEARKVEIDPSLLGEEKGVVEDLIVAAVNDAVKKIAEVTQEKMAEVTQSMNLPKGFGLSL